MLKWLYYTDTDYTVKLIHATRNPITVIQSDNIIYFNNVRQTGYDGKKKTETLLKEGFVLEIDTLEKYKDLLNVKIGRKYAFAEAISRDFNKYWKFSTNQMVSKEEFANTVKLNFKTDFYVILFRFKNKPLNEFCEFLKTQLSKTRNVDNELLKIVTDEIQFQEEKEDITLEHYKLWIKYWEVIKESDLDDPRLVKLVNWYQKVSGSSLRVILSNIPNSGYGLFTNTFIKARTEICDYGGNLCRLNLNEFEKDQSKNAYAMTIQHDDSVLFDKWTVDSKTCFAIWQVGRWGNAFPLKKDNNAQFEVVYEEKYLNGFPSIKVYSTKDIEEYSEIYINYGLKYDLKTYQDETALKQVEEKRQEMTETPDDDVLKVYFSLKKLDDERLYKLFKDKIRYRYLKNGKILGLEPLNTEDLNNLQKSTGLTKSYWRKFARNDGK